MTLMSRGKSSFAVVHQCHVVKCTESGKSPQAVRSQYSITAAVVLSSKSVVQCITFLRINIAVHCCPIFTSLPQMVSFTSYFPPYIVLSYSHYTLRPTHLPTPYPLHSVNARSPQSLPPVHKALTYPRLRATALVCCCGSF